MINLKSTVAGLLFFTVAVLFISNLNSFREFMPAQEVDLSNGAGYGPIVKDYLFVQEVTLKKRFIRRIDVFLAKMPSSGQTMNVFNLLDSRYNILFTKKINSDEVDGTSYYQVDFQKYFDIGKGNKMFVCLNSIDGTANDALIIPQKPNGKLGSMYVIPVQNNDLISSLQKKEGIQKFEGSIGLKTYETNNRYSGPLQLIGYILAFFVALIIVFFRMIKSFLFKFTLSPEYAFLFIGSLFGFIMVYTTPPFQVPDEPMHFYRSYQIADLDPFNIKDSVPLSLVKLTAICDRMKFKIPETTSSAEIHGLSGIKLNPGVKAYVETTDYLVPYIPQAVGIGVAKMLSLSPLMFLYFGRIFNLLISVILLFFAIRKTPVLKWLFFMLGILPMTLYQMASLSYDAVTISLSFLLIAFILDSALNEKKTIRIQDLMVLLGLAFLLAASKPPYFIVSFAVLIIPIRRFGSWKRFFLFITALAIVLALGSNIWAPAHKLVSSLDKKNINSLPVQDRSFASISGNVPQPAPVPQNPTVSKLKEVQVQNKDKSAQTEAQTQGQTQPPAQIQGKTQQPVQTQTQAQTQAQTQGHTQNQAQTQPQSQVQTQPQAQTQSPAPADQTVANPFDPAAQKKFILGNPVKYLGIISDSFIKYVGLYMTGFVGLFGWVDTPLPAGLVSIYWILMVIVALGSFDVEYKISLHQKAILFGIFILGFILIETAMYLYCNPVGCNPITAVQGRYFIGFGPFLFVILYNSLFFKLFERKLQNSARSSEKEKRNKKKPEAVKESAGWILFIRALPWFVAAFSIFGLVFSLMMILLRFYIVLT